VENKNPFGIIYTLPYIPSRQGRGEHTPAPLSRRDFPSPLAGEGGGEGD